MDPHIGITGFMSHFEVVRILGLFPEDSSRELMAGVWASWETLSGKGNRHPKLFPKIGAVSSIFPNDPRAINLIHYSTDELASLEGQLNLLISFGGEHLDGFQLNIAWPDKEQLKRHLTERHRIFNPKVRIVLQINQQALNGVKHSPESLADRVCQYGDLITDILFDLSVGKGELLKPEISREYLCAIHKKCPDLGLGVAGVLDHLQLPLVVAPLLDEFPRLSINTQLQIRDRNKAELYVSRALEMFDR